MQALTFHADKPAEQDVHRLTQTWVDRRRWRNTFRSRQRHQIHKREIKREREREICRYLDTHIYIERERDIEREACDTQTHIDTESARER